MADAKNVGTLDGIVRILLGIGCVALIGYDWAIKDIFPAYALIPLLILIPFFLKTGITKVCPIMKALKLSTRG